MNSAFPLLIPRRARRQPIRRRTQRPTFERLEDRTLLAVVTWDGGGGNLDWNDPLNWSGDSLPTSSDDAEINVPGDITVVHFSGATTVKSLQSEESLTISGGSFTVLASSEVNGSFVMTTGAALTANGSGASFTANGPTTISAADLFASGGAVLRLPAATSYAGGGRHSTIQASGPGSVVDLSSVTSVVGASGSQCCDQNNLLFILASGGGRVDLSQAVSLTGQASVQASGAGSVVDFTAMDRIEGTGLITTTGMELRINSGGSILVTNVTTLKGVSLFANDGLTLALSSATSYTGGGRHSTIQASGPGSVVDLSSVTSVIGASGLQCCDQNNLLFILASGGGRVDLSQAISLTGQASVQASGAGSVVDFAAMDRIEGTGLITTTGMELRINLGGSILVPNVTALKGVSLFANDGLTLALPSATSYVGGGRHSTIQASGPGSVVDLSNVTSVVGASGLQCCDQNNLLFVLASGGGRVDLSQAVSLTGQASVQASGAGSVVDFTAMDRIEGTGLITTTGMELRINLGGSILVPNVTSLKGVSLFANDGLTLALPSATSYTGGGRHSTIQASGPGSVVDLSNVTSVVGASGLQCCDQNNLLFILASGSGRVDLSQAISLTGQASVQASGAGSVVDFTAMDRIEGTGLITTTGMELRINSGGSILVPNVTTLKGVSLFANDGLTLALPSATSYTGGGRHSTIQASGPGSVVDLSNVTSVVGASGLQCCDQNNLLFILASGGGRVDLSQALSLTGQASVQASGAGSVVDFTAMDQIEGTGLITTTGMELRINSGGSILVPNVTTVKGVSLFANDGLTLALPAAASYVGGGRHSTIQASGPGSVVDLSNVTSVVGASGLQCCDQNNLLFIQASGGGRVDLSRAISLVGQASVQASGGGSVVDFTAMDRIEGTGLITTTGMELRVNSSGSILVPNVTTLKGVSLFANDGLTLALPSATSYVGGGRHSTIQASGPGSVVDLSNVTSVVGASGTQCCTVNNLLFVEAGDGGRIDLSSAASISGQTNVTARNGGIVTLSVNTVLSGVDAVVQTGGTIGAGLLGLAANSTLSGTGILAANLVNSAGQVSPGSSPGVLDISGDFTQTSTGTLNTELAGLIPGTQFDQVNISGQAELDGTLNISRIGGFAPGLGDTFEVLTYTSRCGEFRTVNGRDIGGGLAFANPYGASSMSLVVVVNQAPTIGSLDADPASVVQGGELTLTASGVADSNGSVGSVDFYHDTNSNGQLDPCDDTLLGSDTDGADGWSVTASTETLVPGTHTFLARSTDNDALTSNVSSVSVQVTASMESTCTAPPADLLAWWPGDGDSSDIGGGYHAVVENGATFASGKVSEAFSVDGVDDHVAIPDPAAFSFERTQAFSVDAWINFADLTSPFPIVSKTDPALRHRGYDFTKVGGGNLKVHLWNTDGINSVEVQTASAVLSQVGRWYHVAVTYDGSSRAAGIRFYVDGAEVPLEVVGDRDNLTGTILNDHPLLIGASESYPSGPGLVDEVEIYTRALGADEIQAIFAAGSAGKCKTCMAAPAGLVSWWPGEENADDVADSNPGILQNGVSFAAGRVGQAFSFDGVDDYVDLGNPASLRPANAVTAEAWFNADVVTQDSLGAIVMKPLAGDNSYGLRLGGTKLVGRLHAGGNDYIVTGVADLVGGRWYHGALTYDSGDGELKLYLDGVLEASAAASGTIDYDATHLRIGAHPASSSLYWDGLIDEVTIYDHALTATEIRSVFASGGFGKCREANTAPTADAGGPYMVAEGSSVVLDASGSSDPDQPSATLTYEWDFNTSVDTSGDGDPANDVDATGISPTFSAIGLDGSDTVTIGLRVTDAGGLMGADTATIEVTNIAPALANVLIDSPITEGSLTTLTGTIIDPGDPDTFRLAITWGDGSEETLALPAGTTTFSLTHVYADDPPNTTLDTYAVTVAVSDDDLLVGTSDLLVSSWFTGSVKRYSAQNGAFVDDFASGGGLARPRGIAFGPDGNLYVSAAEGQDRVLRFDGESGAFIDEFVSAGTGGLANPWGLTFGADGDLFVASRASDSILRYDGQTGAFLSTFVLPGSAGLDDPLGLTFGPDGNLYVASFFTGSVYRFHGQTGLLVDVFVPSGSGGLNGPVDLAFGPDEHLYVTSTINHSVLRYDGETGVFLGAFVPSRSGALDGPNGLGFGPDGHLYVTSDGTDSVKRYDGTTGAFIDDFASGGGLDGPSFLVFRPSELSDQVVVTVTVQNVPPTITAVTNNGPIPEGSSVVIAVSATDPAAAADPLSYEFDCDSDGSYEVGPQSNNSGSCSFADDGSFTVNVRVTDGDGGEATASTNVEVRNVLPTATLSSGGAVDEGSTGVVMFSDQFDPSSVDTVAGFHYAYDFDNNGTFELGDGTYAGSGAAVSATVPASYLSTPGSRTVTGRILDEDDGLTDYTTTIIINDVAPEIDVTKSVSPTSVSEGGVGSQSVTYSFTVRNASAATTDPVTIQTLTDSVLGALAGSSACQVGTVLAPGESCSFDVTTTVPTQNAGTTHSNTFTAAGTDDENNAAVHSASATVSFADVAPTISVAKTAGVVSLSEPGGDVTFTVEVANTSPASTDPVTLATLTDDVYGDLNGQGTCATGGTIAPGGTYSCSFTGTVAGDDGDYTDIATATASDDEGNLATDSDDATVSIVNVAPAVTLDSVAAMDENGVATLTGTITDPGTADTFTLVVDWGDPLSPNNVETFALPASSTGSQTFTLTHQYLDDNPTLTPQDTYTITATVTDDDSDMGSDVETVLVRNVAPMVGPIAGPAGVSMGTPASFSASFTDPGTLDTHTCTVSWGDGTSSPGTVSESGGSGTCTATHTYASGGAYTVTFTVTDDDTDFDSESLVGQHVARSAFILNPTLCGALTATGNAETDFEGPITVASNCADNAIAASGNAHISADRVDVVGVPGWKTTGNATITPTPTNIADPVADPLDSVPAPTGGTDLGQVNCSGNSVQMIDPGVYSRIQASGNCTLTMNPGTYIVAGGGYQVSGNASVTGVGVTIYNAGSSFPDPGGSFASLQISGNGVVSLTPPSSGLLAGIIIFQARDNTKPMSLAGNASGLDGTIYAKAAQLSLSGNGLLEASLVVANLRLSGNAAASLTSGSSSDGSDAAILAAGQLRTGVFWVSVPSDPSVTTPDQLARIRDAIATINDTFGRYGVTLVEVDIDSSGFADIRIQVSSTSPCGDAAAGVLGCSTIFGDVTFLEGWNWYAGADAAAVGGTQYDLQTIATHELGHAIGAEHSADANSVMYGSLTTGASRRLFTASDLEQLAEQHNDEHDDHALAAALFADGHAPNVAIGHSHDDADPLHPVDRRDHLLHSIATCPSCTAARSASIVTDGYLSRFDSKSDMFTQWSPLLLGGQSDGSDWERHGVGDLDDGHAGGGYEITGRGRDVLIGGDGTDVLVGRSGHDRLIGGYAANPILGTADDTPPPSDTTAHTSDAALAAILQEWTQDDRGALDLMTR